MFAKRLKKELERKKEREPGCNQSRVAELLGVSTSTISCYLHGNREPYFDKLVELANLFDCSVDYLLGRTDVRQPNTPEMQIDEEIRDLVQQITNAVNAAEREGIITADEKVAYFNEAVEQIRFKLWQKRS